MTKAEIDRIKKEISKLEDLQADTLTKKRSVSAVNHIHTRIQNLKKLIGSR